jgi:hypothetical protein
MDFISQLNEYEKISAALITGILGLVAACITLYFNFKQRKQQSLLENRLKKVERLEANRYAGYEEIWKLTGMLNIFGPAPKINIKQLSTDLKDWYFTHGFLFPEGKGRSTKDRYFLVQEVINFAITNETGFERPADSALFNVLERPLRILKQLRNTYFNIGLDEQATVSIDRLHVIVDGWKSAFVDGKEQEVKNWVLLQSLLSKFRTCLKEELYDALPKG